jgi:FKBP-type peptidyl-prolyl cis-trans isomerase FklB
MKSSLISLVALVLAGTLALAAPPAADKKPGGSIKLKPAGDEASEAPADEKDEPADEPASDEGKPGKKPGKKGAGVKLSTVDEKELIKTLSYMQGFGYGKQLADRFKTLGIELDLETLQAAFKDGAEGKEPTMTEEEMQEVQPQIQKLIQETFAAKNKREGEEFLATNKKEEGVKTLPSGLQYKVVKSGKGESPKKTDTVKAHYKGTFLSGQVFDSSYERGQPASFPVTGVIKGWTEALQLMKVGDKWKLFVPAELAYQEEGMADPRSGQQVIPPNATLVFEVELLGVEKGSKAPAFK